MKIIFDILGFLSIIGAMLITILMVTMMLEIKPFLSLISIFAAVGYLYVVFSATKDKEGESSGDWAAIAISGFFLLLFINFLGCVGLMPK